MEGQVIVPSGYNLVGKIANAGFRKILDPMVNAISATRSSLSNSSSSTTSYSRQSTAARSPRTSGR